MGAHDAAARGDARIEHGLHDLTLVGACGQVRAVTLPVRTCPRRLFGNEHARNVSEEFAVALGEMTAAFEQRRQTFQLLASYGGLDVGHAVVVAELVVRFENHLRSAMADGVGY